METRNRTRETTYERWMREEELPIVRGYGVEDVLALPRAPWRRLSGSGTFIKLEGMQGFTGLYVCEIPPGARLNPEKHLYEEAIYVLKGRGAAEIYTTSSATRNLFEWQAGSLFAMPINAWHQLSNGSGTESAVFVGFTNAPLILDLFHNPEFVFGDEYVFKDRYDGRPDYFTVGDQRYADEFGSPQWETNFVPDVRNAVMEAGTRKGGAGSRFSQCQMSDGVLVAHIAEWPSGRYHKAHYHGAGAVILIVKGIGYSLLWPNHLGSRPFEAGHGDQVHRINWKEGTIFGPPDGWFHQHFNTGREPARLLAQRYGSHTYPVEFHAATQREGVQVSLKEGGTVIEYEDEDPEIQRLFATECAKNGAESRMQTVGVS